MRHLIGLLAAVIAGAIVVLARLVTAVRAEWRECEPSLRPRVYFANHASHGDFALLWTVLPACLRARTRPVAAADYWLQGCLRRFVIRQVFGAVLIDRRRDAPRDDPIDLMARALDDGASLMFFPEGTRNRTYAPLLPFKGGLYRLVRARPAVECVPVWIDNLNRVLPKGEWLPVPLLCTVTFGAPITVQPTESQAAFLERARGALLELRVPTHLQARGAET
jgi:1-acyl-sn-glycerol-3-phosphate acyltransferase